MYVLTIIKILLFLSNNKNFEIIILLHHYWKQEFKSAEAAKEICEVEREDVVSIRTAQKWFRKFNEGHMKR